ncbi:MAG: hypothetical protein Q8R48_04410 [Candidatus Omnitrophota bacterium]|nr:hypothetical protein [Candidatus Omnitrophota bacterium]
MRLLHNGHFEISLFTLSIYVWVQILHCQTQNLSSLKDGSLFLPSKNIHKIKIPTTETERYKNTAFDNSSVIMTLIIPY